MTTTLSSIFIMFFLMLTIFYNIAFESSLMVSLGSAFLVSLILFVGFFILSFLAEKHDAKTKKEDVN